MDIRGYSLHEHSFRFAGWCAATAAGRSPNCRFTIETGMKILSTSGVKEKSRLGMTCLIQKTNLMSYINI